MGASHQRRRGRRRRSDIDPPSTDRAYGHVTSTASAESRLRHTEPMAQLAVGELGTILSVWAHPDDEGYCCGGLMATALRDGQRVVCVTATRGELGSTDPSRWPNGPELAAVRTRELAASLAEFGVTEHHWLDYPDGGCAAVDQGEAVARLRAIIDRVQPDTVLTFGPDGATYHPDHMAVSRWVSTAAAGANARGEVGPRRGAGLSTGPFPRAASRTRRASFDAPGSPQASVGFVPHAVAVVGQGVGITAPR